MKILAIDTSNHPMSVALVEDEQLLATTTLNMVRNHSIYLMPAISKLFELVQWQPTDIDRVVVAQGPGSYTGVRIGVTVAKTLAWTLKKPLVGVSSLEILARNLYEEGYVVPLFDARRQSVFAGVYDGKTYESVIADGHYDLSQLLEILSKKDKKIYGFDKMPVIYSIYSDSGKIAIEYKYNTDKPYNIIIYDIKSSTTSKIKNIKDFSGLVYFVDDIIFYTNRVLESTNEYLLYKVY